MEAPCKKKNICEGYLVLAHVSLIESKPGTLIVELPIAVERHARVVGCSCWA
jgi:hypothetical protein